MPPVSPLTSERLRPNLEHLLPAFRDTLELLPAQPSGTLPSGLGQARAMKALRFGVGIERPGYNIFLLGPTGSGRKSLARAYLQTVAANKSVPNDWCYVQDFGDEDRPRPLALPPGIARRLHRDMQRFVEELDETLTSAFEADDYRARREAVESEYKGMQDKAVESIQEKARAESMTVLRSPMGFAVAPVRDGEVLSSEDFEALPEDEREGLKAKLAELETELETALGSFPRLEVEQREKLRQLNSEVANFAIDHLISELRKCYEDVPAVSQHLDDVRKDILEQINHMIKNRSSGDDDNEEILSARRYLVNLFIDHADLKGAPIIFEDHPTLANIIGRIDHRQEMGALQTDFLLIKPGALHRASGGYLLLDAAKLLAQPSAYEAVKRALRSSEIRIETVSESIGMGSTSTLDPRNIPFDAKVVLFGERDLYYALLDADPDFRDLFKVAVDFDDTLPVDEDAVKMFAQFVAEVAHSKKVLPLQRDAVLAVMEHTCRLAEDQLKMLCHAETIANLLYEADFIGREAGLSSLTRVQIEKALAAQIERSGRARELVHEQIRRGLVLIDICGAKVGQINALSVLSLGNFAFGRPSRITARVRVGQGQVVDIEREVDLGGPSHSKGVLILSSYLGARYAPDAPLAMRASLVFEQSYGGVDGDSASAAELIALLSAIAQVGLRQDLAVTGSVNQLGEVQAIGGVNEKIEGFFAICESAGLSGTQGVVIPKTNVVGLALSQPVIDAVTAGKFHIFPIATIDEGIELFTGKDPDVAAGPTQPSFHQRVRDRLDQWLRSARSNRLDDPMAQIPR
jgi:predicted ATP-dependent protease